MRTKILAITLALLTFFMFCSPTFADSGSTDKEVYYLGEPVEITINLTSGGISGWGELVISRVSGGGWIGVRSYIIGVPYNVTFMWDQQGNTTDPRNGPFDQVLPGYYELLWFPSGVHGFEILCAFQILAPVGPVGGSTSEILVYNPQARVAYIATSILLATVFIALRRKTD